MTNSHNVEEVKPLSFQYDAHLDILTVEGIRYSGSLFRGLGIGAIGTAFRLTERRDGVVTLQTLEGV